MVAKVKEVKKAEVAAPAVNVTYQRGEAKYSPRVDHTKDAWEKVEKCLMKGKGKTTYKEMCDALEVHFNRPDETHHDFIGYMVRRGALAIVPTK